MISSNCHRIQLQTVGTSTFLNVHDTVSHEFELHRYSPVLHPLLSEIMMGDESQHWWLLDSGAAALLWPLRQERRMVHGLLIHKVTAPSGKWQ